MREAPRMLEIRTDDDARPATPDGPHDHEQTRAIAEAIGAAARLLNYATSPEKRGLRYPSDVYTVLGSLASAVALLPQALGQMTQFIGAEVDTGHARENPRYGDHGGDAAAAHAALRAAAQQATGHAEALRAALDRCQAATRGLESSRPDPEDA
ncbi:hypothetical protein AGRA3207_007858 (plasmid) [Actinomadura graeca]|uniref:Uncharacterized protein n=1 Tax=Actinomadura graeca TaxID=2750812 RepID=A0ABX8R7K4_9ACTN|nr:hypothetical protein [Actinomadura graeca]QXJ27061.1 hypothetical protein AGRA3207_007858 [Actinomadura graeca]